MAERKVTFTGVDSGVSNMMNRLREDSKQLTNELIRDAQSYSNTSRQQIQYIEEQIRAIERRNRVEAQGQRLILERQREAGTIAPGEYQEQVSRASIETRTGDLQISLLRELIEAVKATSRDEIREDRKGVQDRVREFQRRESRGDLGGYTDEELFKLRYQGEILGMGDQPGQRGGMGVFGGVVAANLLNRLGGLAQQVPRAQTQLDLLGPAIGIGGAAIGAGIGTGIDIKTGLQSEFQIIGAEIGAQVGEFYSEALLRSLTSREALEVASMRIQAITGRTGTFGGGRGAALGLDRIQEAELAARVATITGRGTDLERRGFNFQALQAAFGFDEGLVARRFALERMGQVNTTQEISRILRVAQIQGFFPGGEVDQTTFADLIRSQTDLIEQLSQTATVVDPNQALRTVLEFDRMGGMFSVSDPRSGPLRSAISQSLANPQNDFVQAATFQTLRRLNPGAGLFDLMRMQQQGAGTPGFIQGMLETAMQGSDDPDFQRIMLSQLLPNVPLDAIDTLFNQAGRMGSITDEELARIRPSGRGTGLPFGEQMVEDRAVANVTRLTRDRADITNAFIEGATDGITTVAEKFGEEISRALEGAGDKLREKMIEAGADLVDEFKKGLIGSSQPSGIGVTDSTTVTANQRAKMMGEK